MPPDDSEETPMIAWQIRIVLDELIDMPLVFVINERVDQKAVPVILRNIADGVEKGAIKIQAETQETRRE